MYRILNEPMPLQDGTAVIHYDGIATTTIQQYLYEFTQDIIVFRNMVQGQMTVTVGSTSTIVRGGENATFFDVTSFSVVTPETTSHQFFSVDSVANVTAEQKINNISAYSVPTRNILLISDSIMGQGGINTTLGTLLNVETRYDCIKGGSCIATGLAEMADEIWAPQVNENALTYSNDLTNAAWVKHVTYTITKEIFPDGQTWNKIVKTDNSVNRTFAQSGMTLPSGFTGALIQFHMYLPPDSVPAAPSRIGINLKNLTRTSVDKFFVSSFTMTAGKSYCVGIWYSPTDLNGWIAGDTIQLEFVMNKNAVPVDQASCTTYMKNLQVSFMAPVGYQRYVQTTSGAKTAEAPAWTLAPRTPYSYRDLDAVACCFGRNDSGMPTDAYPFFKAYNKLVDLASRYAETVVFMSPPPQALADHSDWDATDSYNDQSSNNYFYRNFLRMKAKRNSGVDIFKLFKDLVSAGKNTVDDLMADLVHPSNTGGTIIATELANEITEKRKPLSSSHSLLSGKARYYLGGIATGSWKPLYTNTSSMFDFETRMLNQQIPNMSSSVQNDTLSFGSIDCEQLHVIFRQDAAYGTFDVIIDEGTPNEAIYSYNASQAAVTNRQQGRMVVDFGITGTHTVKIKVTSSGKVVTIGGIVAI